MKNIATIIVFCTVLGMQNLSAQNLNALRNQYIQAVSKKSVCESLIEHLRQKPYKSSIHLAYIGTLEAIWAKYVLNPFSKLQTFKKGKEKIEQAVRQEPHNIEIRYLRLSVQKNVPGFLGYNDKIEEDELFLKNNLNKVSSEYLRKMIENALKG